MKFKISTEKIWFALLAIYLIAGYIANDVLLSTRVGSLTLYLFLAYSAFAIIVSGKIKLSPIFYWEVICLVLAFIAMLYSPEFNMLGGNYYAMLVNFVLVFIFTQMPWSKKYLNAIFLIYVLSAVALIISLALTGNLIQDNEGDRLGSELMGNANTLAMILMVSAIAAIWLLISSESKRMKLLMSLSLAAIYLGMFLSGGRKFVVIPIVFAFVLLLFKVDKKGRRHIIKSLLITACVLLGMYLLIMKVPFFYNTIGHRFDGFFALFSEGGEVDSSTQLRMDMIEAGFYGWLDSPLWGYGFDSFKYYNEAEYTGLFYYSHNNFVELLFNQGIIGFCAYYGFYVYLFIIALKTRKNSLYKGFVIGLVLSLLIFEYFGVTYGATPVQLMLFYSAFCLRCANDEKPRTIEIK